MELLVPEVDKGEEHGGKAIEPIFVSRISPAHLRQKYQQDVAIGKASRDCAWNELRCIKLNVRKQTVHRREVFREADESLSARDGDRRNMAQRIRHTKVSLPNYNKSFALLSDAAEDEVKRAVIFIHGFNGSARGTWTDFLSLVDDPNAASGWWERADLFFFDYQWDSVFRQLTNNTLTIYKFVNDVFPKPEAIGRAHSFRSEAFEYDNLTLVGHSEGGLLLRRVIVRAAQLDTAIDVFMEKSLYEKATRPAPEGMLKADMRLFAPALGGDMQSGIVGILSSLPVVSHALSASAAKKGMDQGSPSVIEARKRSDNYAKYLRLPCFEAHITWAEKDSIINSEKYDRDHECLNFPSGSSHTSVCKPTLRSKVLSRLTLGPFL